jgi:membrane dipeptidase
MSDKPYLILDSHLDLGFCALQINRDLTQPAKTVRVADSEPTMRSFGSCTTTFHELRKGHVGLVFGTVMSRIDPNDQWTGTGMYDQTQCHGIGMGHYSVYKAMAREGIITQIHTSADLDASIKAWADPRADTPIGLVLAMESADPIQDPDQVPFWYDLGLRMVSISHYGTSSYCHGTGTEGGLLDRGRPLLDALKDAGIIVDLTHTTDQAFWEILDYYDGPVAASHHNCRALVPGQRQLTDEMIKAIAERGGVIGAAFDAWMLDPDWKRETPAWGQTTRATLETVADHIDHIAQLVGSARHSGIGSDLDGGFGQEQSPRDLNTIADLQRIPEILDRRGYSDADIANLMSGNWIRLLKLVWG